MDNWDDSPVGKITILRVKTEGQVFLGGSFSVLVSVWTGSGAHPALHPMGNGVISLAIRRGMKLFVNLHLVPR
jgi:hypothetical protein